jgi:hypothetical protein
LRQILSEQQKELDSLKDTISEAGRDFEKDIGINQAGEQSEAVGASVVDEPSGDQSQPAEPAGTEPAEAKPAVKKAATKKPAAAKKATAKKPAIKKPVIKKPVTKKPKSKPGR